MPAILSLIPVRDWFYGAIAAGALVLGWHYYDKYNDAVKYQQTVQAESAAALAAAKKQIADDTIDYNTALLAEERQHANDLLAATEQHNDDVARLLAASAARTPKPVLHSSGPAGKGAAPGARGPAVLSGLPEQAVVCQRLSDALKHDDDVTTAERAERDALTGK